jgi:hypothetical protein
VNHGVSQFISIRIFAAMEKTVFTYQLRMLHFREFHR